MPPPVDAGPGADGRGAAEDCKGATLGREPNEDAVRAIRFAPLPRDAISDARVQGGQYARRTMDRSVARKMILVSFRPTILSLTRLPGAYQIEYLPLAHRIVPAIVLAMTL